MKIWDFGRDVLGIWVAVVLAGCGGGSQPPLAPSAPSQPSSAQTRLGQLTTGLANTTGSATTGVIVPHPDRGRSWMAPEAKTQDLLYISDLQANDVHVYSYPQGKVVGKLTGLYYPDGECTDKKGDIWIVNNQGSDNGEDAVEYRHGGTKPIATVHDGGVYDVGCSVDPVTGNLAVTASEAVESTGPGNLAIFVHGRGNPKYDLDPAFYYYFYCAYDDKGNLYIVGAASDLAFEFAELPKGGKKFKNITLKGATINFPGNVQWDGKYVAIGEQEYQIVGSPPYWDSAIYRTTGTGGKIVGVTPLTLSHDVSGYWIDGKTVIGPSSLGNGKDGGFVGFWNYPAGGKPTKKLTGFDSPYSAAISLAK